MVFGKIFLILMGVYRLNYKYNKISETRTPNIILSSQSSIIDWIILMYNYSPKFLWIVKSPDNQSDLFIELSYFDVLIFGMGLKFLSTETKKYKSFDIEKYIQSSNQIPLVIFPENTKTNRKGVLKVRSNLMDNLYTMINDHSKILIRAEVYSKCFKYNDVNNTTEYHGVKTLFFICSQFINYANVYTQDILNANFSKEADYDKKAFRNSEEYLDDVLQSFISDHDNRLRVGFSSVDHIKFLEYFHETNKTTDYVKKDTTHEKEE